CLANVVESKGAILDRDAVMLRASAEVDLGQFHDPTLFRAAHGLQEPRTVERDVYFCGQAALMRRNGETERLAPTGTGHHENGGRLSPQADFQHRIGHECRVEATHCHHEAAWSASKIAGLGVKRDRR